ncbi:MAG: DUF2203 domain-containing protein [Nocardioidaceae bacterium]
MGLFTLEQAREQLAKLRPLLDEFVALRADATELGAAVAGAGPSPLGGIPELKAVQARMDQVLTELVATGVEFKGFAPLLMDFPAEVNGEDVHLCWLEGDEELSWYHRVDLGFAGRRRLP